MAVYTDAEMVDDLAQQLFESLVTDSPTPTLTDLSDPKFSFDPDNSSPLYATIGSVSLEDLTEVSLDGSGVFDRLMAAVDLHIQREFRSNRITGDQYAKVYTEIVASVLNSSVQFALSKEQAKWAAITAQMQARITEIQATEALVKLEDSKVLAQKSVFSMKQSGAEYALTKMQIATENGKNFLLNAQTEGERYKVDNLLPVQYEQEVHKRDFQLPAATGLLKEQWETQRGQTLNTRTDGLTAISGVVGQQRMSLETDVETKEYQLNNILPVQLDLVKEQREAERAKTLDTRTDLSAVTGSIGKQKDLYTQQIDSFVKDAKYKVAKMYLDNWITQKTLDENITPPTELTAANAGIVLANYRSSVL